jgi:8-oxo-dGTP diphosphatase
MVFEEEKIYPRVSANVFILDEHGYILLTRRGVEPYKDYWVIPGGHVKQEEAVDAAKREMYEELDVHVEIDRLYGVYANLNKDPRRKTLSIFYVGKLLPGQEMSPTIEVSEQKFFPLDKLPKDIGFNHKEILDEFRKHPEGQSLSK